MRKKRKRIQNQVVPEKPESTPEKSIEHLDEEILLLILNASDDSGDPVLSPKDITNFALANRNFSRVSNDAHCFFHKKSYTDVRSSYMKYKAKIINSIENTLESKRRTEMVKENYYACTLSSLAFGTIISAVKYDCAPLPTAKLTLSFLIILNLLNYGLEQYLATENELNKSIIEHFNSVPLHTLDMLSEQTMGPGIRA